jgi:hypothetical protein
LFFFLRHDPCSTTISCNSSSLPGFTLSPS